MVVIFYEDGFVGGGERGEGGQFFVEGVEGAGGLSYLEEVKS